MIARINVLTIAQTAEVPEKATGGSTFKDAAVSRGHCRGVVDWYYRTAGAA